LKREGSTEVSKLARQERVYRLVIRGLKPLEIARQENVDERTIQRDFQEIKFALLQIIQTQQLRTHKLALAELDEIWRELWTLYHRAPRENPVKHGNEMRMTKEDDRPIKVIILAHLAKVSDLKNRLIFQISAPPVAQNGPPTSPQNLEQAVADLINTLPEPLRSSVRETLERQTGISEENN
jgi:AraC-like DNA-binding protein